MDANEARNTALEAQRNYAYNGPSIFQLPAILDEIQKQAKAGLTKFRRSRSWVFFARDTSGLEFWNYPHSLAIGGDFGVSLDNCLLTTPDVAQSLGDMGYTVKEENIGYVTHNPFLRYYSISWEQPAGTDMRHADGLNNKTHPGAKGKTRPNTTSVDDLPSGYLRKRDYATDKTDTNTDTNTNANTTQTKRSLFSIIVSSIFWLLIASGLYIAGVLLISFVIQLVTLRS